MKEQSITPQPTEMKSAEQFLADKLGYDNCATDLKEKIVSAMEAYKNQPTMDKTIEQNKIINRWARETASAYNLELDQVNDDLILSYLAQQEIKKLTKKIGDENQ